MEENKGEILLYQTPDGESRLEVRLEGETVWLNLKKTAFLASSTILSETVLRCYDWATEMRNRGECVVSGFSSKLEQDVR